jgi:hypothetical protein
MRPQILGLHGKIVRHPYIIAIEQCNQRCPRGTNAGVSGGGDTAVVFDRRI